MIVLSDQDQRILAMLDADIAARSAARVVARLRARFSSVQLVLSTVVFSAVGYGGLGVAISVGSRGGALLAIAIVSAAPSWTVLAYRYTDTLGPRSHG